ncbi:uncharacterized protein [Physcomitrium patens]|uniref:Enkurin domain-containing protein n=1 Tax=Physcomitrium patens TaxID=3218 RepID=A0A2K1KQJ2_PHYPA|nr:enkurin-like [Physcomitrium patens]XP_024372524.1 enkurin-like [Physcomitrium patens]XP_024372525.1 enkurin-like [Physcomitrium patens]PNR56026.1 hypothetical protein PHYPA_006923 [Physcomitrium patens]|eukprot:XP_024372523.1 enkurin-like [Physcomitrella patens]
MWNSHESVYKIIKPSEAYHAFTPPQSAKELRDRKVDEITLRLKQTMRLKAAATFGRPLGSFRPSARNFLRKHSKEPQILYGAVQLRCTKHEKRKPDLPKERPTYGKVKMMDYIKTNAEQMIHSSPNRSKCPKKPKRYALRRGFATVPTYLASRMRTLTNQNNKDNLEQQAADCGHKGTRKLDEKERITLMNNLKLKWADMNARYQRMSVVLDIESKKRRKERYEENLSQLERDIALLSRSVILVSDSVPAKVQKALTQ